MPKVRRLVVGVTLVSLLCAGPAQAYRITRLGAQHERFTTLAEQCVARLGHAVFEQPCGWPQSPKQFDKVPYKLSSWGEPVRWPDDVKRRATGFHPIQLIKLGYLGLGACRHRVETRFFPGLQCESDVGRLQFFHAMRALRDAKSKDYESNAQTRGRILAWTRFGFRVATREEIEGTDRLCDVIGKELETAFVAYCAESDPRPGPTVADFFASTCKRTCLAREPVQAATRAAALGAILHLIQDSFSQSHTARGGRFPHGPYAARIVCSPVEEFYAFDDEQAKVHKAGDLTPTFDLGCLTSPIPDPITATARLMWLWQFNCHSDWAVEVVDKQVLGGAGPAEVPASAEQCLAPMRRIPNH